MNIYLLGATGSIGTQTLDIIRKYPEYFTLYAASLGRDMKKNIEIIDEFHPVAVCVRTLEDYLFLEDKYKSLNVYYGNEGLISISTYNKGDKGICLNALMGSVGLIPTVEAIKIGRDIALANKETLVIAGEIVMNLAKENNVRVLPVDSEHSAIFQCLKGEEKKDVKRIIITASGGAFRDKKIEELENVTKEDALAHPSWNMGEKITIDSATMMNKGFEIIEAHWLFDMPYEKIVPVMHRESIVHSMVEFNDSSIIAQLGAPDMRIPIIHALGYPKRIPYDNQLDLLSLGSIHFEELSFDRFPVLKMAIEAGKAGGIMPTVLNAANEAAVSLFLRGKISFLQIEKIIRREIENTTNIENPSLRKIISLDKEIKEKILNDIEGEKI